MTARAEQHASAANGIFACPYCREKLFNRGPGVAIRMARPITDGEPLKPGEIDFLCESARCKRQRWAVSLQVANAA